MRKVFLSLRHDRRTLAFLILMPVLLIAIFGYTFGGELHDVDIVIVDLDEGVPGLDLADATVRELMGDPTFRVLEVLGPGDVGAVEQATGMVRQGRAVAAIVFPENFTQGVLAYPASHASSNVSVQLDASNLNIAQSMQASLAACISSVLAREVGMQPAVRIQVTELYGEGARYLDSFAPGVICLTVMIVTFMLSIISFVHERSTGTLDRLLTTTATESEIVAGHAMAFGVFGLVQSCVVLATASLLFGVMINGSAILILLLLFLLGLGMQGLGLLFSASASTEFQAIQFLPLVLIPSIFLCGVFWPLQSVPDFLMPLSYVLPLTYAADGLRSVMLRGWGLDMVWLDVAVLILFFILMLIGSLLVLRRRR
jgi:ABC-2 type transport system permease protein